MAHEITRRHFKPMDTLLRRVLVSTKRFFKRFGFTEEAVSREKIDRVIDGKSENPDELLEALGNAEVDTYQRMLRDDTVKAAIFRKCSRLMSWEWQVQPPDDPTDMELLHTEFIRENFKHFAPRHVNRLTVASFNQGLWALCDAVSTGYSIVELIMALIPKGKFAGKIGLAAMKGKNPLDYGFDLDEFSNVNSIVSNIRGQHQNHDWRKFIIFPYNQRYADPHGTSDLQAVYRAWKIKDACYRFWIIAVEKYGMGMLKGTFPKNYSEEDKTTLLNVLRRAQKDTVMIVPEGVLIEIVEAVMRGESFENLIDNVNKAIMQAIEGATLHASEGKLTGARNMGLVHADTATLFTWILAIFISEVLNDQLIPRMIDINWNDTSRYPTFGFVEPGAEDITAQVDVINKLLPTGLPIGRSYAYEISGIPMPKEGEELLEAPAVPAPGGALPFFTQDQPNDSRMRMNGTNLFGSESAQLFEKERLQYANFAGCSSASSANEKTES